MDYVTGDPGVHVSRESFSGKGRVMGRFIVAVTLVATLTMALYRAVRKG